MNGSSKGIIKVMTLLVLVLCGVVLFLYVIGGGLGQNPGGTTNAPVRTNTGTVETKTSPLLSFLGGSPLDTSGYTDEVRDISPYSGSVYLSSGNAFTERQPYLEYITITNNSSRPINITGWKLVNAKGDRPIETRENSYVYPVSDTAIIPSGTQFLSPEGVYATEAIILNQGDRAIVTSGGPFIQFTLPITVSFRENICTGYLNDKYPFNPYLNNSCPLIRNDVSARSMTRECTDYLRTVNRCENPDDTQRGREELDLLSSQCQRFVRERVGYENCVQDHRGDANFYQKDWRVFLGRKTELWGENKDKIRLYDATGKLIAETGY